MGTAIEFPSSPTSSSLISNPTSNLISSPMLSSRLTHSSPTLNSKTFVVMVGAVMVAEWMGAVMEVAITSWLLTCTRPLGFRRM